jgi:predicted SAM-dependent methyltransferase
MGIILIMILTVGPLFVAFGQITVRKLRKNPETKYALGLEFSSGWDILNVAEALSATAWMNKRFKSSKVSFLFADAEVLYKHTTRFDRILARIFWFSFVISGIFMISVAVMSFIGFEFMNTVIDI